MFVSVIMPSYNVERFLPDAIQSVQAQTYGDWELLISDDGSTDATRDIAHAAQQQDNRIRLLASDTNVGPARCRNAAIAEARGRYIAFLDSDDMWKPEKLERQVAFMQASDQAFSFSSYDRIDEDGRQIGIRRVREPVTYTDTLKRSVIGCLTAIYDADKLGKVYMPDIRKRQDLGLWLKILRTVGQATPLPDSLALYRVRGSSVSSNKFSAALHTWRLYRDVEKLGLGDASYYFAHYAWNGFSRTYLRTPQRRR